MLSMFKYIRVFEYSRVFDRANFTSTIDVLYFVFDFLLLRPIMILCSLFKV